MTETSVAYSTQTDSKAAGRELGERLREGLGGRAPDVILAFVSPDFSYAELLSALQRAGEPGILIGCSSAGEFMTGSQGENAASALALIAPEMRFSAGLGRGLGRDLPGAVQQLVSTFHAKDSPESLYRSALVFVDGLSCQAESLVEQLNLLTGGTYQFIGGGAADNARFERVHVFQGTEAVSDAVVALERVMNQ